MYPTPYSIYLRGTIGLACRVGACEGSLRNEASEWSVQLLRAGLPERFLMQILREVVRLPSMVEFSTQKIIDYFSNCDLEQG